MRFRTEAAISALGLVLFLFLVWPMAVANIDDMAMIRTFGGDETAIVDTLNSMLDRSSPDPGVYKYGALYFQAPFLALKFTGLIDPRHVALVLRIMSVLGGLACLAGLALGARALFGPGAAVMAMGLSCALPLVIRWSKTIHPDTLGLAGLVVAWGLLLLGLKRNRLALVLGSAALAGVAAGIKLNSAIIVLFLPLALLALSLANPAGSWTRPRYALAGSAAACGLMVVGGLVVGLMATPDRLAKAGQLVALETGGTEALPFWVSHMPQLGWVLAAGGVLLLVLLYPARRMNYFGRLPILSGTVSTTILAALLFGAGFFAANSAAFFNPGPVAAWFLNETVRMKHSYVPEGLFFFKTVVTMGFWGWLGTALSGLGFAFLMAKPADRADRWIAALLAGWVLFNLLYLTHSFSAPKPRHAAQVLPALVWLGAAGLTGLATLLGDLFGKAGRLRWLGLALAALLLIPGLKYGTAYGLQLQKDVAAYASSPAMETGRFLEKAFAPETVILHDPYIYIPMVFTFAREEWEPSLALLDSYKPDLVVINQGFYRRYIQFDNAAGLMRPAQRQLATDYYHALLDNGAGGRYEEVRKFGGISVMARRGFKPRSAP